MLHAVAMKLSRTDTKVHFSPVRSSSLLRQACLARVGCVGGVGKGVGSSLSSV